MREETYVAFLLPMRLFTGWLFVTDALGKLTTGWILQNRLQSTLEQWIREGKPYEFFLPFLHKTVLPNASLFGWAIGAGELLIGAALMVGLFSRISALFGLALVVGYLLAHGDAVGPNSSVLLAVILFTFVLASPGRVLGLDAMLRGKIPRFLR